MKKEDLTKVVVDALKSNGGSGTIIDVCKYTWKNYKDELQAAGDLFFTWQYDIRWAATELRKERIMKDTLVSQKGIWELIK